MSSTKSSARPLSLAIARVLVGASLLRRSLLDMAVRPGRGDCDGGKRDIRVAYRESAAKVRGRDRDHSIDRFLPLRSPAVPSELVPRGTQTVSRAFTSPSTFRPHDSVRVLYSNPSHQHLFGAQYGATEPVSTPPARTDPGHVAPRPTDADTFLSFLSQARDSA